MAIRAAIYARVSTDDQRGNYSIPTQLAECMQQAKRGKQVIVGDRFVDSHTGQDCGRGNGSIAAFVDDFTSRELSRPSLDAALAFLETAGFDVLIVHALDRLARDPYIRETLEREFEKRGAKVEYVLGNYDESAEGEVRKDLDATFAKWENAKRVERCLRGKRGKAESGLFVAGRAPFGFRIDKKTLGGLAVESVQIAVVQRIFHSFVLDGQSIGRICDTLTAEKVKNWRGKTIWSRSSVARILCNEIYIGRGFYNKHRRIDRKRLDRREHSEWIEFKVTPVISPALFERAQLLLRENRDTLRRQARRFYLLSGKVFCEDCKHAYSPQASRAGTNRRKSDALDYRHRIKSGHCLNRMVSARKLEPLVWEELVKLLLDPANLYKGYQESLEQHQATQARNHIELETLGKSLARFEQRRQNLTAAYIDPEIQITKAEYLEQKNQIDGEIKSIKQEIARVQAELDKIPTPAELETLEVFATTIRQQFDANQDLTPQDKRAILDLLHVRVLINVEGKARITGLIQSPSDGVLSTTY
jgi:site-specific DNA recombinase